MKRLRIALVIAIVAGLINFVGPLESAEAAAGDLDTSMYFDGSTQYVRAASAPAYILTDSFTVEAWLLQFRFI
jgi:hypothetical protein